ncbi:MAG: AMP-binding protein [Burkholderiales bacterium]|nr:MAG: AMP-binding protein [Burkholderiales bacterium]
MSSLLRRFAAHAGADPERIALRAGGLEIDYAGLCRRIAATAVELRVSGIAAGDRLAFLGYNEPEVVELLAACAEIGAMLVPLNFRLAAPEHQRILEDADAGLLVVGDGFEAHAQGFAGVRRLALASLRERVRAACAAAPSEPGAETGTRPAVAPGDDATGDQDRGCLLVYTSGTSGAPKGAIHSPAALLANARAAWAAQEMRTTDHVLTLLPMFHVGGLCIQTLPALLLGATVTLHGRFDARAWLQDVERLRPTLSLLVPPVMKAIIEHPDFSRSDLSSLRLLMAGSSVVPVPLIEAFHARGVPVGQVYGATETGPVSIVLGRADAVRKAGAAGWPAEGVEVSLHDPAGATVPDGAVGEIWLRAPNLARGYWHDADNAAFAGGWYRTGDLAHRDAEGCYYVVGRARDMIVSGGDNIYRAEIEQLLEEHPAVAEAAVVGMAHAHWGEVPVAAVVPAEPGAQIDTRTLIDFLVGRLARFKLPHRIVVVDRLPKSALGKVQKAQLRDELR